MMTKTLAAFTVAVAAVVGIVAPTAGADPTPSPSPGYQIPSQGHGCQDKGLI
jgi:hypothetical protein